MNSTPSRGRVLLIGWDAADWEHITPLLDAGKLPTLEALIDQGVMGNLATLQPILSPMLWNSVATGKHAYKHGVCGFIEPDPHHGGARPYSSYSRRVKALWNIASQSGLRSNVVNWWASHPAEPINGCVVTNLMNGVTFHPRNGFEVPRGTFHPAEKARRYAPLKVFPNELTAEHLCPFVPRAAEIDQEEDSRLETLSKVIAETATTQAVATALMELEPWDFMAVYFTGIDHFSHAFMHYHPPRMAYVPERDFEIFKDVIAGAYRFHDMILERLLQLAGAETTVFLCSDHGFHSRALRPLNVPREPAGPAIWHRRFGIFVARGPGIRRDERVYGASLVDVAPTILAVLGLPVGQDMDGRVLSEIFDEPPEVRTIPSWEEVPGPAGLHSVETPGSPEDAADLMKQFVALGYIDDPGADREQQAESADIESKYNLARNYQWLKMDDAAIPLLEELLRRRPWESRFIVQLATGYLAAGYVAQAGALLHAAYDVEQTSHPQVRLLWAAVQRGLGRREEATDLLRALESEAVQRPGLYQRIGELYLKMRRWPDALRVYRQAVQADPDNADAHVGLSSVHCHYRMDQETVDEALAALGLVYRLPQAHFNLGVALARVGDAGRAVTALETALRFGPRMVNAHRCLSAVYRSMLDDRAKADYHLRRAREIQKQRMADRVDHSQRRDQRFELPEIPAEREREERLRRERPPHGDPRRRSGKTLVLVSGLPRSGTSLMMQMLEAGGLPPQTDRLREADENNPRGYMEWEEIKQIGRRPEVLDAAELEGRAIKCVSPLVKKLPYRHEYRILFMSRAMEEVVASQAAMIDRLGGTAASDPEQLRRGLKAHRAEVLTWMKHHPRIEFIEIDYGRLVTDPAPEIERIVELLGGERLPHPERMAAVIDRGLHRQRLTS